MQTAQQLVEKIEQAAKTVLSVAKSLPTLDSISTELKFAEWAQGRGYFLPNEDEAVRSLFAEFLRIRAALRSVISDLMPFLLGPDAIPKDKQPEVFVVTFTAACLLFRSGRFILDNFCHKRVVWKKLDEAEPSLGISRKSFTHLYRSVTSPRNVMLFMTGVAYTKENQLQLDALAHDPVFGPVVALLRVEQPLVDSSFRRQIAARVKYRLHSYLRRNHSAFKNVSFAVFKWSGSLIAEMRDQRRAKRVTQEVRERIAALLRPGDVIVTRHDDAASNLFLPGFWPHAALYIGTFEQREALGVTMDEQRRLRAHDPVCVLEARKDGVLFRELEDTLSVDCFTVIRPRLNPEEIRHGISRATKHEGKSYDFEFDFRRSDKLVCTEVTYRAFHGLGNIAFELKPRAGRLCISAEDLLDRALDGSFFDVVAVFGAQGNQFVIGEQAHQALAESYGSAERRNQPAIRRVR